jgi:flagellar assembly protein FliH
MTSSSDRPRASYARFIPREELSSFAAWAPGDFDEPPVDAAAADTASTAADLEAQLHAARQSGYQDGYRDGLVALEGFKQSFALQTTQRIGTLLQSVGEQLDALQQEMAASLALAATQLARQVVRAELKTQPQLVAQVAQEALEAMLLSARHITLRVHPDDHADVAQGAAEVLAARGARLLADASIARGGCRVESDIGVIDAGIEARWRRAAAALGSDMTWDEQSAASAEAAPR